MVLAAAIREEIEIPEGVEVIIEDLETAFPKKKDKSMIGTTRAHINNMITGVTDGFTYHMKIVFAHFPMAVKVQDKEKIVTIENFIGERHPRTSKIVGDAKVQVKGDEVIITGVNKEDVGQTMANLEQATKIRGKDPRVFQDGIYLTSRE